jgi:NAD(P)-dependent dehydrogenase (short-subunit alcohol dehydrogenase family)
MSARLEGKVAVVVGAGSSGSGLSNGRAAAILFAREGAKVFAMDANADSLLATRAEIEKEGGTVETCVADIIDAKAVAASIEQCVRRFGTVNVLHNNVGIASTGGIGSISDEEWDRVVDTNLTGARNTCRAVLPVMAAAGGGAIVNVSSLLSRLALRNIHNIAYSVSKAGLEQLTRVIAMEYAAKGIRANNLVLGLIETPQIRASYERRRQLPGNEAEADRIWLGRGRLAPLGRQGTPWEVAKAALFLASDESSYITGVDLRIDGGLFNVLD